MNYKTVPIFICAKDRVSFLARLVSRLESQGYSSIGIVDTGSTYPPMKEYLWSTPHALFRPKLEPAKGQAQIAYWYSGISHMVYGGRFVYTDCDVVPVDECPDDWLERLWEIMDRHPDVPKAGLGLKIDDLPDCYAKKAQVIEWEKNLLGHKIGPELFMSQIDTTLALYRNESVCGLSRAIRTGGNYLLRHLPWYSNSSALTEEESHYRDHMDRGIGMWHP